MKSLKNKLKKIYVRIIYKHSSFKSSLKKLMKFIKLKTKQVPTKIQNICKKEIKVGLKNKKKYKNQIYFHSKIYWIQLKEMLKRASLKINKL